MDIESKFIDLNAELKSTLSEMQGIKIQIAKLNKKGEELAQHCNFIKGKIEAYEEMKSCST